MRKKSGGLSHTPFGDSFIHMFGQVSTSMTSSFLSILCLYLECSRRTLSTPFIWTSYRYKALTRLFALWTPSIGITLYQSTASCRVHCFLTMLFPDGTYAHCKLRQTLQLSANSLKLLLLNTMLLSIRISLRKPLSRKIELRHWITVTESSCGRSH